MKWILKRLLYLAMFGGVIFVPLVIFSGGTTTGDAEDSTSILDSISNWFDSTNDSISAFFSGDDSNVSTIEDAAMTTPDPDGSSPHLDGGVFSGIEQVLDFKITPAEITSRWARVSFHVQDSGLHSYRVPVVTGEDPDDLAGSLTFLFDRHDKLQRLEFLGFTHDPSTLIILMKNKFRMTQRPSSIHTLLIKSQNKLPVSALRIVAPTVVSTSDHSEPLEIRFELNRLKLGATLSESFRRMLKTDQSRQQI